MINCNSVFSRPLTHMARCVELVGKRRRLAAPSDDIATLAIHGGDQRDPGHGAVFPPITTATSFVQPNLGEGGQFCYSRVGNPTRHAYETALAAVEGGTYCTATASGMAATSLALELLKPGDHAIAMEGVYGGTHRLFEKIRRQSMGIDFSYLNLNDSQALKENLRPSTRMVWIETPTSSLLQLVDIVDVVRTVRENGRQALNLAEDGIIICADNTFATAWNQRPLRLGVDIVMLSTSKYVGGHSDMTGGALITNNEGIATRLKLLTTGVGSIASPFDAYLGLRGLKTLAVRMERQSANAQRVAEFLHGHPKIERVYYPGLPNHPDHELCKRQTRSGGAVVTAKLKDTTSDGYVAYIRRFFSSLKYWILAESLGGVESMINHSATMSHGSMSKVDREKIGVYDTTLRFSVGLECVDDLVDDLSNALDAA